MTDRSKGPWDESEVDFNDGVERVNLGGLLVTGMPGVDVQVQVDQASGNVVQLTFAGFEGAVQIQPYAAPKSGGYWETVRGEILAGINGSGGLVETVEGPFGPELHAQVHDESGHLVPARFAGIDGPRWFLRAVFLGAAARSGNAAAALENVVRSLVVVRGREAMAAGSAIPMRLPDAPVAPATVSVPVIDPFERGPEITEIR
ncbi:MAG: hypothetical protein RL205_780 [Actinomycetota bacterium]